ncbi:ferric reductase-like transmembrane domain-containing protein [Altericista sp. CCNU0014]|uniref:ferric reductase-like transmembrane domain-containing protein n=1 Tax=Altericista sp. CCNU0014 TaxID=3082949 RepID=UPI00384C5487
MLFDPFPLSNSLGFLALGGYIATLLPTNLRIVFPQTKQSAMPKWLLKNRRAIGILSFCLTLGHGYLLVVKRDFDFFDPSTFWVYIQGVTTFIILALLTITSNDWSVKRLKKNWKRLHNLTYLAMFLLTWHVWDKMADHWSALTPLGLIVIISINILYLCRRWIERRKKQQNSKPKISEPQVREKIAA